MKLKWKSVGFNYAPGKADLICDDIDKDGKQELLLDFNYGQYFTVMKYIENDYQYSWISPLYLDDKISSIKVCDINNDLINEICVLHSSGIIDVFNAKTMIKDTTLNTSINNSATLNIDDLDKDGTKEFIIGQVVSYSGYASIYIINSQTMEPEWSLQNISIDAWDIKIGDVDNDSVDEIVVSNGLVIDGVSHKADWNYVQGFGTKIALGDIDGDSTKEIISISNYFDINAFDVKNKTPLWSITSSEDLKTLYVTDVDEDGIADIIVGNNQWGYITCYSPITKNKIWAVNNPNSGSTNITIGDPDNDGSKEVIWSAGEGSSGPDYLYVGNIEQENLEWQSSNLGGPFSISIYDVNEDGFKDICGTCFNSDNGYSPGRVFIYNPINYNSDWIIGTEGLDYWSFNAVKAGNINDTEMAEIVAASGSRLYVFEAESHKLIWSGQVTGNNRIIRSLEFSDIDNDGVIEILVGDENGYLYVLNGKTFQEEWHSVQFNGSIEKIIITNWDADDSKEIVVITYMGNITVLDGITHYIEWQSNPLSNMTTCDLSDINKDGSKEFIIGSSNGQIMIVDSLTKSITDTLINVGESITALKVENLDMDPSPEIVVGTTKLYVFHTSDLSMAYESEVLGSLGFKNNLVVTDVENDQHMDIVASNNTGIFQYRCEDKYPDITPPTVVSNYPKQNATEVTTGVSIKITFSEEIDVASLTKDNISLTVNDTLNLQYSLDYSSETRTIIISSDTLLPGNALIKVNCSGNILDQSLNGLDGNKNGISEGTPVDDFILSFTTGIDKDTIGPAFTNIKINKNELWPGFDIKIEGIISDSSNVAISQIVFAECFIDSISTSNNSQPIMPKDGIFNSTTEDFYITIQTNSWTAGEHKIYLVSKDYEGNTGSLELSVNIISHDKMKANWPMFGQNPQHTGFNLNDSIKLPLNIKWTKKIFNNPINQLAVAENIVFATENNNQTYSKVFALNAETGDTIWVYNINGNSYVKSPTYYKGRVYVSLIYTPNYGYILVLDASNGEYLSTITWGYEIGPYLTIADDKLFTSYEHGNFYTFNALNDKYEWRADIYSKGYDWVPAYAYGIAYSCGENSSYCAFDADSGKVINSWGTPMIGKTPLIKDDVIYTSSPVSAINVVNNKILWTKSGSMPSAAYGKIFLVNKDSLFVLDESSGNVLWKVKTYSDIIRPPIISNNYVFLNTSTRILAIDINTHNEIWDYNETGEIVIANNHLYFGTIDGKIICFYEAPVSAKDEMLNIPKDFNLMQNFPNPFNPVTTIKYSLPMNSHVRIEVFNALGESVKILVDNEERAGYHTITWNADNVSSGVYFYRIIANGYSNTKKLLLLK